MGPSDTQIAGEVLLAGTPLRDPTGVFVAQVRADGDLAVLSVHGSVVWSAGTGGNPAATMLMQDDGDLVLYSREGARLWSTCTAGHPGAFLQLHDDGRLVVHDFYRRPLWSSGDAERPVREAEVASAVGW
jgi:hypothetical protein